MEYIYTVLAIAVAVVSLFFALCRIVNYVVIHPFSITIVELKNTMAKSIEELKQLISEVRADVKRQEAANHQAALDTAAMKQQIRSLEARVKVLENK